MADIDNLNFQVILDDKKFNDKIRQMEKAAKDFNVSMSKLLDVSKTSQQWSQKDVDNNRRALQAKVDERRAQEKINREKIKTEGLQRKINAQINRATKGYQSQSRILRELKGYALGYLSIHGATQLLSSLVRVTGEYELQKTTLSAMLGDLNQAETILTQIKGLAIESPFTFGELSKYAKQLSAFSVPAKELYDTTKMLADVSAGLGVGMDRIVLAYGQIRSAAFLRGQEVRQLTEAGIPILEELSKQFTELEGRAVSAGEVFDKISARLVPFEMVAKVFEDMTSEGGKFYEMQSIQSETLRGRVLKLKDAYEIMLNEIGSKKSDKLKGALDSTMNLMKNWEKIGFILKTLIVTYGTYKATLASVWAYEKAMAGVELIRKWQRLNQMLIATTGSVNRLATAMKVFGITSKAAVGAALGAIAAIVTITITAIKNANALRKELESIVNTQVSSSDKMTDELSRLVDRLKEAKQGSQAYRDAISELNNKYGDYLPKIYSEADAYAEVKTAADAAAEAIRNKAQAQAFEKGTVAIEEKYGKGLTELAKGIENTLMFIDPDIPKKAAVEFVKTFKKTIQANDFDGDYVGAFESLYKSFFRKDNLESLLEIANGKIQGYSDRAKSLIEMYGEMIDTIAAEQRNLQEDLETRFGVSEFSSFEEMKRIMEIDEWYRKQQEDLKSLTTSQDEYNSALEKLEIKKLRKLIDAYNKLKRPDMAKEYQKQLEALTKTPEGWRGTVQAVLKEMGLKKNTSFGLWADEYTQSTNYVDEMIKRYKELKDEIKWVSPFDEEQTKRLKKNKEAIEAVAKALNIDIEALSATKGSKGKSQAQKDIETQIDLVKKLQDAYEKLSPYLNEQQMRDTLSNLFPAAKKEWLESFDFSSVLEKLADDLAKYDAEAAKRLKSSVAKDVAGSMAEAFKEIEAYKKMLDEWMGEDFNLAGKGVTLDINKIIRDLNNQYNQIDQKRLNALQLLKKTEIGDAEAIKEVRRILGEEMWNEYLIKGSDVIEELTRKEKQSARQVAEEKIRDKATSYMKELLESRNIDITDLGDKSTNQLRMLIGRMKDLQLELSKSMGDLAAQMLNNEFDKGQKAQWDMLAKVIEMLGLKIEDVGIELDKAIFENMKDGISVVSDLADEITRLGEAMDSSYIVRFGDDISNISDILSKLIPQTQKLQETLKADGVEFTKIMGKTKRGKEYTKSIESNTTFSELSDAAKGGIIAILATVATTVISEITDIITHAVSYQETLNNAMWEYNDALLEIKRNQYSGIFGTDDLALDAENVEILASAQEKYNETLEKFQEIKFQRYGDNWKKQSISDILGSAAEVQGWDLYLEDGELNIAALEAYYDAYSDRLSRKQKNLVKDLIESGNAVNDAAAQQAQYLTDLYSGVADTIADNMVNAFIESGDAAIDMGEIVSDTAKTMVADLIKSLYILPILKQYEDQALDIQKSTVLTPDEKAEAQLSLLDTALSQIAEQENVINETIERFADYLEPSESGTTDLGDGIKGITEDQANLLASYLNAIRADVSYSKALWERMDANLQRIADMFTSSPTLMEYQAQIAANTYDTAIATQEILSKLRSVITSDTGDASIRVHS